MDSEIKIVLDKLKSLQREENRALFVAAIDGRCAAGKTTLAARLQEETGCAVFHMDDFFLRPEQRTRERLSEPGGNVDYERFAAEVLDPLKEGRSRITFRAYDCKSQTLLPPQDIEISEIPVCSVKGTLACGKEADVRRSLVIVEGAYSCHPALWDAYDCRIFLTVSPEEQLRRIIKRNGEEGSRIFKERWIPLEEKYFEAFAIQERCDCCCELS